MKTQKDFGSLTNKLCKQMIECGYNCARRLQTLKKLKKSVLMIEQMDKDFKVSSRDLWLQRSSKAHQSLRR